jgi:hypothetical protein
MKAVFSGNSAAAVVLFLNAMPCQFLLHHAATVKKKIRARMNAIAAQ